MNQPFRLGSRNTEILRSHLTVEIALTTYAAVSALLIARLVILLLAVPQWIWIRETIGTLTDIFVWPLTLIPEATRPLLGDAALPDLTAVGVVVLVPLLLIARNRNAR